MIATIYARKRFPVVVLALVGLLFIVALAAAEDRIRVELFDTKGQRTGYAIVDRESGRVELLRREIPLDRMGSGGVVEQAVRPRRA